MKKWLIIIVLLVGCSNKEEMKTIPDNTYYQIATPYLESVGNYSLKAYDKEEVEARLMDISMRYFKPNNSFYQGGQYLTKDDLKLLLSEDYLNDEGKLIKAIYEQNYLASNGVLKGVSLAIVLDPNQEYIENGKTITKTIEKEVLIEKAKAKTKTLLEYIKPKISNVRILVAIYIDEDDAVFHYSGITSNTNIKFEHLNYHYEKLDNDYVISSDINSYNNYKNLKEILSKIDNIYITSKALYKQNDLVNLNLTINTNYLTKAKLLYLTDLVANNLKYSVSTKVYIKNNDNIKAILINNHETLETNIYVLEE